jgi:peptidoglycan/xylan/chitin deacetylase (PgdA/CDA1 family)
MARPLPFLMYHEVLAPGRSPARPGEGYARYVIDDAVFREHLDAIRGADAVGVAVGDGPGAGDTTATGDGANKAHRVVLTFDDGCESDLVVAAPLLRDAGFRATFFVTVAHLDTPGFMSRSQLRELADAGFEIGSHGMTHAYMSDLDDATVESELAGSKAALEDMTGVPVEHFSCPGGRWSIIVAAAARRAGYRTVCASRPIGNAPGADRFRLGRYAITTTTTTGDIARIALDGTLGSLRFRSRALGAARAVLGNRTYDRVRSILLERPD